MTPITAFTIVALTFALGDFIANKTRGIVSTFITATIVFMVFGGMLDILPPNLIDISGLSSIIPTFGMALILTNLGSALDINDLKKEWKTIIISVAGLLGVIVFATTIGQMIFGREYALSAISPISGGIVATMIASESANQAGKPEIAQFVACIMAFQMMVGLPIASVTLKKAVTKYVLEGKLKNVQKDAKRMDFRFIKETPKSMDNPTTHFARLAMVATISQIFAGFTGINGTICYLFFGVLAVMTGIVESNSLKKAGGDGVMLLATYSYVVSSCLTLTLSEFTKILFPAIGLLVLGAVGIAIFSAIAGLALRVNPYLSVAMGISCMYGYPVTYAVAMEVVTGVTNDQGLNQEEQEKLVAEFMPKMIVAGVVSVSVMSVIIAGIVAPLVFK